MLALRAGRRPDIVVFYDGVNDTFSAYSQQLAGLPNNEWNRVAEFNMSRGHLRHRSQAFAREVGYRLATVTLIRDLLEALGVADSAPTPTRPDSLAGQVVATYLGNLELLRALSEHYHFQALAYWQPTLLQKPRVTQYESLERAKLSPGSLSSSGRPMPRWRARLAAGPRSEPGVRRLAGSDVPRLDAHRGGGRCRHRAAHRARYPGHQDGT